MQGKPLDRTFILNVTIVVEALLLLIATLWCQFCEIELLPFLHLNSKILAIGLASGLTIALSGFAILWLCRKLSDKASWIADLRSIISDELTPLFQTLNAADILMVAACSGFCEEIFFRGVVQDQLGLFPAALLFGFFHCPTRRYLPYCLWAVCAGTFLGWLLTLTNSLWAPVFAHGSSNLVVLLYLRYGRKMEKSVSSTQSAQPSQEGKLPEVSLSTGSSKVSTSGPNNASSAQATKAPTKSGENNQSAEPKDK
ncbi:MAG TPA: CPBP family intramembrane glutamic endopeptidase [Oculatellaceae cyanobacterium]